MGLQRRGEEVGEGGQRKTRFAPLAEVVTKTMARRVSAMSKVYMNDMTATTLPSGWWYRKKKETLCCSSRMSVYVTIQDELLEIWYYKNQYISERSVMALLRTSGESEDGREERGTHDKVVIAMMWVGQRCA